MSITHDELCWVSAWETTEGTKAPWLTDTNTCRYCEDIENIRDQVFAVTFGDIIKLTHRALEAEAKVIELERLLEQARSIATRCEGELAQWLPPF